MKRWIYLLSGILFGLGLCLSGMIDPVKVKGFLALGFSDWNPALMFVLGSAVPVYGVAYLFMKRRGVALNGQHFAPTVSQPLDKKLLLGAILFGIGWGTVGVCPGPALAHLAFLDANFAVFIVSMFAGFELQRRTS